MAASAVSIYFSCKFSNYKFPFVAFHLCFSQYAPMKLRIQFRLNKVFTHTPFPSPSSSLSKATVTLSRCHTHIQITRVHNATKGSSCSSGRTEARQQSCRPASVTNPQRVAPPTTLSLLPLSHLAYQCAATQRQLYGSRDRRQLQKTGPYRRP